MITSTIMLDVSRPNSHIRLTARQTDTGREIKCRLTNAGVPINVTAGSTVSIECTRLDGEQAAFAGQVLSTGEVVVPIAPWMLVIDGFALCSISVRSGNNIFGTPPFKLVIEYAPKEEDAIEPTPVPTPTPGGTGWTEQQVLLLRGFGEKFREMLKHIVYKDEAGVPGYQYGVEAADKIEDLVDSLLADVHFNVYSVDGYGNVIFTSIFPENCEFDEDGNVFIK